MGMKIDESFEGLKVTEVANGMRSLLSVIYAHTKGAMCNRHSEIAKDPAALLAECRRVLAPLGQYHDGVGEDLLMEFVLGENQYVNTRQPRKSDGVQGVLIAESYVGELAHERKIVEAWVRRLI